MLAMLAFRPLSLTVRGSMRLSRRAAGATTAVVLILWSSAQAATCSRRVDEFGLFDTEPQARDAGVDYLVALAGALWNDTRALSQLFRVTRKLDGAGSQSHSDVLLAVLECWGDEPFAARLAREAPHVQQAVREKLLYALCACTNDKE